MKETGHWKESESEKDAKLNVKWQETRHWVEKKHSVGTKEKLKEIEHQKESESEEKEGAERKEKWQEARLWTGRLKNTKEARCWKERGWGAHVIAQRSLSTLHFAITIHTDHKDY